MAALRLFHGTRLIGKLWCLRALLFVLECCAKASLAWRGNGLPRWARSKFHNVADAISSQEKQRHSPPLMTGIKMLKRIPQYLLRPAIVISAIYLVALLVLLPYVDSLGQDINYDLMNYHLFSADNLIHGAGFRNIVNEQQFLAPYVYLPFYVLETVFGPRMGALILAAMQLLNLALVPVLAYAVLDSVDESPWIKALLAASCTLVAASSPMFLTEIGTSFADILTTIPAIGGLILWCLAMRSGAPRWQNMIAGMLLGIAAGLKLTAAIYPFAVVVSAMVSGPRKTRVDNCIRLVVGSAVGFSLVAGWWTYRLYDNFDSPLFPFFNNVLKSKFYPASPFVDARFIPKSFSEALTYPLQWLVGLNPSSELPFRDARFVVIFTGTTFLLASLFWRKLRSIGTPDNDYRKAFDQARFAPLLVFFIVCFVTWLKLFSIQRYIVGLELIAGVILMGLVLQTVRAIWPSAIILVVLSIGIAAWAKPSDFGHSAWAKTIATVQMPPALKDRDALYLLAGLPMAYIVPEFSRGSQFVDIGMHNDASNAMGVKLA